MERPRLKRDWIGRLVKLRRGLRNGRTIFPKGLVMQVDSYRGTLSLETEKPCPNVSLGHLCDVVTGRNFAAIELLPRTKL